MEQKSQRAQLTVQTVEI